MRTEEEFPVLRFIVRFILGTAGMTLVFLLCWGETVGLVHAFRQHGTGDGWAAVFVPPWAFWRGIEFFLHEDGLAPASSLDPKGWEKGDSGAYVREGLNYLVEGDERKAFDSFKRAILADPNNADAYAHLGHFYYELHDIQEAISHWRKAFRIDPENSAANFAISHVLDHASFQERDAIIRGLGDPMGASLADALMWQCANELGYDEIADLPLELCDDALDSEEDNEELSDEEFEELLLELKS